MPLAPQTSTRRGPDQRAHGQAERASCSRVSVASELSSSSFSLAEERLEASRKADSDLDLSSIVPEGLTPYGFQVAGVEYALKTRRTIIGDEMGLGKTVQAILAVEAARKGL